MTDRASGILQLLELEVTPENFDVIAIMNLKHETTGGITDKVVMEVSHGNTVQPGLYMVAFYTQAQGVPLAFLQNALLLIGNLLHPAASVGLVDAARVVILGSHLALPAVYLVVALYEGVEEEAAITVALLLKLQGEVEVLIVFACAEVAVLFLVTILGHEVTIGIHTPFAVAEGLPAREVLTVEETLLLTCLMTKGTYLDVLEGGGVAMVLQTNNAL